AQGSRNDSGNFSAAPFVATANAALTNPTAPLYGGLVTTQSGRFPELALRKSSRKESTLASRLVSGDSLELTLFVRTSHVPPNLCATASSGP
ncbi:unnamed protein product, partial [Pylaiella littoralis]